MNKKETRAERKARWEREGKAWEMSGLGGGNMVEVGSLRRGQRGSFAHRMLLAHEPTDWLYREGADDEPEYLRLFVFVPADTRGGNPHDR